MSRVWVRRGILLGVGAAAGASVAIALGFASSTPQPVRVVDVPPSLPARGVVLADQPLILTPLGARPAFLSERQAIRRARTISRAPSVGAHALLARVTFSRLSLEDVPSWVVTFTLRRAVRPDTCAPGIHCPKRLARHRNVVLAAASGRILLGFYTP